MGIKEISSESDGRNRRGMRWEIGAYVGAHPLSACQVETGSSFGGAARRAGERDVPKVLC